MMHRSVLLVALALGGALPAHAEGTAINNERIRQLALLWITWHRVQCPALYTLTDEGLVPGGIVMKAQCGKADGSGTSPNLVYRITLQETGFGFVRHW
jgi:hypothetical protein